MNEPTRSSQRPTTAEKPLSIESRWREVPGEETSDALVAAAKLCGIDHLWFVSGSELAFFQEAITKANALGRPAPELMTMLHEHVALAAAGGESMVSGRPSAAVAHVELGLLNMGGAIHDTYRGDLPVLMMTGYPATTPPEPGHLSRTSAAFWSQQQWDQGSIVRQYVKWDHKLTSYDNPALIIARATQVMLTDQKGPAYLALPPEVAMAPLSKPALLPPEEQWGPALLGAGDEEELQRAAELLVKAEKPLALVDRVGRSAAGVEALIRLAELLALPVATGTYRMNFPDGHPLKDTGPAVQDADAVRVIDFLVPWIPGRNSPNAEAKVIKIGTDPIHHRVPLYEFPAHVKLVADSAKALHAIADKAESMLTASDRSRIAARRERLEQRGRELWRKREETVLKDANAAVISRGWLSYQLGQHLEPDDIVVTEMGDTTFLRRTQPGTLFNSGGASLGWGAGAALGVKVAKPDRTVVSLSGDGSWVFAVPTAVLWAARYHKAPFLEVVWNNRGYRTGTSNVLDNYPQGYSARSMNLEGGWFDPPPDFAAEAAANGYYGEKVTEPAKLGPAIRRALDTVKKQGVPALLDVWLPKHVTGEGAPNQPKRAYTTPALLV